MHTIDRSIYLRLNPFDQRLCFLQFAYSVENGFVLLYFSLLISITEGQLFEELNTRG